jgi:hypothetical protein
MDRDIVNAIHFMYRHGPLDWNYIWCSPDTKPDIEKFFDRTSPGTLPNQLIAFLKAVEEQMSTLPKPDFAFGYPLKVPVRKLDDRRPCYAVMPYSMPWSLPVKTAIITAAANCGFDCEVTGDLPTPGKIVDQIWQGIRRADAVIVDITGNNPNVFYELGLAHALGKEVILLAQGSQDLPFDLKTTRYLTYDPANLKDLERSIENALKLVSARYPHEGPEPRF